MFLEQNMSTPSLIFQPRLVRMKDKYGLGSPELTSSCFVQPPEPTYPFEHVKHTLKNI